MLDRSTELSLLSAYERLIERQKSCSDCKEMRYIQAKLIESGAIEVPDESKDKVLQELRESGNCFKPRSNTP